MRILVVSKFLHEDGGVETYLRWQVHALTASGHQVGLVGMRPPPGKSIMSMPSAGTWLTPTRFFQAGQAGRARSAAASVYSIACWRVMQHALAAFQPDAVHFHGTCYHLTSSVVDAAREAGVPLLMTAHEYKLVCANQVLYDEREGRICTDCVGAPALTRLTSPVRRACIKDSRPISVLGALEDQLSHRAWRRAAPTIVTPSRFMKTLLIKDGWPADTVHHLDLPWPDATDHPGRPRHSILYVGRLVQVKGVKLLLDAWHGIAGAHPQLDLQIVGDGEQRAELESYAVSLELPRVRFRGRVPNGEVRRYLDTALVTVHPSLWYENSPVSIRESLVAGVPAVVSNRGGMPELVGPESGYVVADDQPETWAATLTRAIEERRAGGSPIEAEVTARATSATAHLEQLLDIYKSAIGARLPASSR